MTMTMPESAAAFVPALEAATLFSGLVAHLAQYPQLVVLSVTPATHRAPIDRHKLQIGPALSGDGRSIEERYRAAASDWVDTLGVDVLSVDRHHGAAWVAFVGDFGGAPVHFTCAAPWLDDTSIRTGATIDAGDLR